MAAPVESTMVRNLHQPRRGGAKSGIEKCSFAEDEEEDLLNQIVGLGLIPKDPAGNIPNRARVAEELAQGILVSVVHALEKPFVSFVGERRGDSRKSSCQTASRIRLRLIRVANLVPNFFGLGKRVLKVGGAVALPNAALSDFAFVFRDADRRHLKAGIRSATFKHGSSDSDSSPGSASYGL